MSLTAMRAPAFRWFFLARALQMITAAMSSVAFAFAVLSVDNAPLALSIVMTCLTASTVVFLLLGGVVADRLPRALVIQTCYVVNALTVGVTATMLFTGTATVASLAVTAVVAGATSAFVMPSMQGIIPQLVPHEALQQANAMLSFVRSLVTIGGPVIAGLVVALSSPAWAFVIEGIGLVVAIPLLAMVRLPPPARSNTNLFTDLRVGWSEFRSRTWLWVIVVAFGLLNALEIGAWSVGGPFIAKNNPLLGVQGWGWVLGALGVGTLVTTLVLMWPPLSRPLRLGMIGMVAVALPMLLLGTHPAVLPLMIAAFIAGAGLEIFNTGWNVAMMENVPGDVLSRVSSYDMLGSYLAMPLGTMLFGWLLTAGDPATVITISGIIYAVIAILTLCVPSVWRMGRIHGDAAATPAA